ncbi:uncharacterized protein LOC114256255 [Camellia sinensis]|uniref:uncharacterized protein LOC114256255 n=1 Tax=Camellia sinensis TaxID=4442 RepID=UPI001036BEF2|nr:uncharacterized protein LOC114256255 [Camellia sinensis]
MSISIKGEKLPTNDKWMLHVLCGVHNHSSAEHLEGHSFAGRLFKEKTSLLVDMSKSIVRSKEILVTLKQRDTFNGTTMKTIYNARHRHRVVQRARRSQVQQLLGQLSIQNYVEWHRCDDREIVTGLFWTLPEDNYTWALDVLRTVMENTAFPKVIITDRELALMKCISKVLPMATNLLCRWHISKNVLMKCKKTEFSTYPEAIKYFTTNCFEPYKEKFVAAWTDNSMHFENTTTNNLEKILVESKRSNSVGIDVAACDYILQHTHGLQCAHEIAEYFQQGRPIPLSCINPHWRKLDMLPVSESAFLELDCKTETAFFIEKFQMIDETQQVILLKKLRVLISPDSTFLMELELKTDKRGRGRGRGRG